MFGVERFASPGPSYINTASIIYDNVVPSRFLSRFHTSDPFSKCVMFMASYSDFSSVKEKWVAHSMKGAHEVKETHCPVKLRGERTKLFPST